MRVSKRLDLALSGLSSAAGLASIAVLFWQRYFVVGAIFIALLSVVLLWAYRLYTSKPIEFKSVHWYVEIEDDEGRKSIARKVKDLTINEKNVSVLYDRNISSSGSFGVETNIGDFVKVIEEAGNYTAYTVFRHPLQVGESYRHVLKLEPKNAFTESRESLFLLMDYPCDEIGLHVKFPDGRTYKNYTARVFRETDSRELDKKAVHAEENRLDFTLQDPNYGYKYMLEWEW
jgi:hypothetical protein